MSEEKSVNIHVLIRLRRQKYKLTQSIYCPFMKELVYFNNIGFHHATHDGRGRIRGEADTRMRLNLLLCINEVITRCREFGSPPRIVAKNHPDNKTGKEIIFYELCQRLSGKKTVMVILRRIGNGRLHYYSVRYDRKQNRPRRV